MNTSLPRASLEGSMTHSMASSISLIFSLVTSLVISLVTCLIIPLAISPLFSLIIFPAILLAVPPAAQAAAPSDLENKYGPRPVDGIYVEAVQSYIPPKHNQLGLDFGLWPLNPYYNGFSIDLNYTYHLTKDRAWEVINLAYIYTVDSSLTQELASNYAVSPKAIERLDSVISSNYNWNILYGKFAFFSNNIRYFRSGLLAGPALIITSKKANIGGCFGWSIETFVNEKMAWKFQIRDNYAFGNDHPNNLAFLLGTTYGF